MTPTTSRLALTGIDVLNEYVIGYPVHIAFTVHNPVQGSMVSLLPYADFIDPGLGIRATVQSADLLPGEDTSPPYPIESEDGEGCFDLVYGEARRILVDISSLLPAAEMTPGYYTISLQYGAPHAYGSVHTPPVLFRAPSPFEAAELEGLRPTLARNGWASWTLDRQAGTGAGSPILPTDPARFNRVLRTLLFVENADPAILGSLDALYQPEAAVLAADFARAVGDSQWQAMAEAAGSRYPELSWYVSHIEDGQSLVVFHRSMVFQPVDEME